MEDNVGYKYEVCSWVRNIFPSEDYNYKVVYFGNWFIKAIFIMCREKLKGIGCVKLCWR
jgi:hypothetical protein